MIRFENPLQWLPQQPRTKKPQYARFGNHSPSKAGDYLNHELKRLGANDCLISSNLQQRMKGDGFYANQKLDDPGVVVYFKLKGKDKAMACDRWTRVEHNLWALYLSVSAIRGLERWGGSEFLDGLFTGFKALPWPGDIINVGKQYFSECVTDNDVRKTYLDLVKKLHPDVGGDPNEFTEMQRQYNQRRPCK